MLPDFKISFSYLTRTEELEGFLKSSTLYMAGCGWKIAYIFSINYEITALLTVALQSRSDTV